MPSKTTKSNAAPKKQGVMGMLKKLVAPKEKAKPVRAKAAVAKSAPAKAAKNAKAAPAAAAPKGKAVKNGKLAAPPVPEVPVKKKPPSITITRPEQTRPPVVLPPPKPLEAPIGAPSILLPKGGLPIDSLLPDLRWMYVGAATRYEIEMSTDPNFKRAFTMTIISSQTTITLEEGSELKPVTIYKWRVRGGNDAGWGPWSAPESFKSPEK